MILPVAKLGTLLLKTMSKPIASRLKAEASRHPKFRQLIINLAQANHRISTRIQRRIYGHSNKVEIRPLNEEKAVQAAADLIGELFVFSVAVAQFSGDDSLGVIQTFNFYVNKVSVMHFIKTRSILNAGKKVAGAAVIYEVQRSARSEARKEEARKQEIEALRQKEDQLAQELLTLKQKLSELEHLANSRGLTGVFRSKSVPDQTKAP